MRGTILVGSLDDELQGVYGPIMDLSDHDPRSHHKSPTGILRILVKLSRVQDNKGRIWEKEKLKADTARYLAQQLHATPERVLADMTDFVVFNWEVRERNTHLSARDTCCSHLCCLVY
jgi:hypothetical protein